MKLKIRELRQERNLSLRELGEKLNISFSQLAKIERGESLASSEQILTFASFFNVSADYLLGMPAKAIPYNDGTFKQVKILGSVCAGNPTEACNEFLGYLPAKVDTVEDYFYLEVSGDSMSPTFLHGDYVLVKYQSTANNNDVVVAGMNGQEATVKRFRKIGSDMFLFADNNKYDPIKLTEELDPYIMGIVSGYFRPQL